MPPARGLGLGVLALVAALVLIIEVAAATGSNATDTAESNATDPADVDPTPEQVEQAREREILEHDALIPSLKPVPQPRYKELMDDLASNSSSLEATERFLRKKLNLKLPESKDAKLKKRGRCDYNGFQPEPCERFPCNDHGFLVNGACYCEEPWLGSTCQIQGCKSNCNSKGTCTDGVCTCDKRFSGPLCDKCSPGLVNYPECSPPNFNDLTCPDDCGGPTHGICLEGKCQCRKGWFGEACSRTTVGECKDNCNERGTCRLGVCECNDDYYGTACEKKKCLTVADCSDNGICREGKCICSPRFTGHTCNKRTCVQNVLTERECTGMAQGHCDRETGSCVCHKGYAGVDCSSYACPYNCTMRGHCNMGVCNCFDGYHGRDCSLKWCPNNCSANGACDGLTGKCVCDPGFGGFDCSVNATSSANIETDAKVHEQCSKECADSCKSECQSEENGPKFGTCMEDCSKPCFVHCFMRSVGPSKRYEERPLERHEKSVTSVDNSETEASVKHVLLSSKKDGGQQTHDADSKVNMNADNTVDNRLQGSVGGISNFMSSLLGWQGASAVKKGKD